MLAHPTDDGFMLCLVSFRRKPESSDVNDLHAMMDIPKPWIPACAGMTVGDVGVGWEGGVGCANDFVCAPGSRCNLSLEQVRKHGCTPCGWIIRRKIYIQPKVR